MFNKFYNYFYLVIPVIKEVPRVVTISKTKNVVIECRIQSIFEPQCTWKKDNTVIKDNVTRQTQIERVKDVMIDHYKRTKFFSNVNQAI